MKAPTSLSVGQYEVYLLKDGVYTAPIEDLAHADGEAARRAAIESWGKPEFAVDVNCFALSGPDGLVLVDAGAGTAWGAAGGRAPQGLCEAGFSPEQVTAVLLTHIHTDHSFGLLDEDKARFPNARVGLPRAEMSFYGDIANRAATPDGARDGFATAQRLRQAYGDRLGVFDDGLPLPGVHVIALPGHTVGHSGFLIHDDRRSVLLWGDIVHLPDLQLADPKAGFTYDFDPAQALHSRQVALESAVREGWFVGGGHITGFRRLKRRGSGYAFLSESGE